MGRIQTFESASVVRAARDIFWDKGFEATSVADLERVTGVNRSSLYHAFGNKRGLFDAAVADYLDAVVRPGLRVLDGAGAGGGALLEYFDGLRTAVTAPDGEAPGRGCLLVNCAAGLAGYDGAARAVVDDYRADLTTALRGALAAAGPGTAAGLDGRARTLASLSMSAMLLARVNPEESAAMLTTARDLVAGWLGTQGAPSVETISSSAP